MVLVTASLEFPIFIKDLRRDPAIRKCSQECLDRERHHTTQFIKNLRHAIADKLPTKQYSFDNVLVKSVTGSSQRGVDATFQVLVPAASGGVIVDALKVLRTSQQTLDVTVGASFTKTQVHGHTCRQSLTRCGLFLPALPRLRIRIKSHFTRIARVGGLHALSNVKRLCNGISGSN